MKKVVLQCCGLLLLAWNTSIIHAQTDKIEPSTRIGEIQRVRLDFGTPNGFTRHLLLGFTPDNAATDGFDYGYDAAVDNYFPDDLNWMIEDNRYIIQGVGAFHRSKTYPFGLFLTNPGDVTVTLTALENFPETIDVYIYDNVSDTYTMINDSPFEMNLPTNDYINRFYIAFMDPNLGDDTLSLSDSERPEIKLIYSEYSNMLQLQSTTNATINSINFYNAIGQVMLRQTFNNDRTISIPVHFEYSQVIIVEINTSKGKVIKRLVI